MRGTIFKSKPWPIVILCFVLIFSPTAAFSQHREDGHGDGGHHGWSHSNWGHSRGWRDRGYHHPRGYHWYNGSWWLGDAIVTGLVIGATLSALPPSYTVVYVGGTPYYYDGVYYYRPCPAGYVVVADPTVTPVVVTPSAPAMVTPATPLQAGETLTINAPKSQGGYTSVQLTRYKDGCLGPQGEYYPGNPTIVQLKLLYGK